ncbi:MAG TPA: flagellar motor protein MotB [Candidatus Deferrimicrobium sp.]|nr:flagellar motor protein MotB [Candidatus Deferrimicrobium sp.]
MERQSVNIKKIKKIKDHGWKYHSGTWKVAYADFVTAMMAFFLLMWILAAKNPQDKAGIAEYFKEYDITKGQAHIKEKIDMAVKRLNIVVDKSDKEALNARAIFLDKNSEAAGKIVRDWKNQIQLKLIEVANQVWVDSADDGAIMIQLVDSDGLLMFPAGSSELTPVAKKILAVIWDKIKAEDVKIAIEGHTDAHQYTANGKTNWELSTERASAARKELERLGFLPGNLLRVSGLAATRPISDDIYSPINRRISLLLYYFSPSNF